MSPADSTIDSALSVAAGVTRRAVASFLRMHAAALESARVSSQLHCWIDLTFGHRLSGG